jgi:hypothetical protein
MSTNFFFLFLILILITLPGASATVTLNAVLLADGQTGGDENGEIVSNDTPVDLSLNVVTVPETTETIGGVEVDLTQEVEFVATGGDVVTLVNTALPTATVEIPDRAVVKAPDTWDKQITPPKTDAVTGTVSTNFQTPTTAILVGSPDVVLVFDKAVTILLTGTTGQTAYKLPGGTEWILISGCTGTYAIPNDPPANGECSISNGIDTKILTFHFTHFTGLSATPSTPSIPFTPSTPSTSNSGGHGNTGVGSPRVFGGSSGSSGGGNYYPPGQISSSVFPAWFDNVTDWYRQGDISALEFLNAYQWIVENL